MRLFPLPGCCFPVGIEGGRAVAVPRGGEFQCYHPRALASLKVAAGRAGEPQWAVGPTTRAMPPAAPAVGFSTTRRGPGPDYGRSLHCEHGSLPSLLHAASFSMSLLHVAVALVACRC